MFGTLQHQLAIVMDHLHHIQLSKKVGNHYETQVYFNAYSSNYMVCRCHYDYFLWRRSDKTIVCSCFFIDWWVGCRFLCKEFNKKQNRVVS